MTVYKSQEIDWHPQSDSLGDFPSKGRLNQAPPYLLVVYTVFWIT